MILALAVSCPVEKLSTGAPSEVAGYLVLEGLELLADPDRYRYRIPQCPRCRR